MDKNIFILKVILYNYIVYNNTINLKILTIKCENINKMSSYRISTRNVFGQSRLNYTSILL